MSSPLGPKKTAPPAPPQPEKWHAVPGKPYLETNGTQWRTKAGVPMPGPRK